VSATALDVASVRRRFSSLQGGFAFLDAPGGSQVPDEVGDAIARALREASANLGAPYETGRRVEAILNQSRADAGRFLNCSPDDVVFGTNMTTLDFALSRTASRDWKEGDRILVSRLDHDGGVAPWIELAADRGFEVDWIDVTDDLRLDLADLERKLDERVRVVAFVYASNAVGTITDAHRVAELARAAGALSWVDAVHYAAHEPIDVEAIGCDVLLCSPYKFCGPHLGLAYGRHDLLESWRPYKARPAGTTPVGRRFETGTAPYELLAGFSATIAYLDSIGGLEVVRAYERDLGQRFLDGLPDSITVYGLQTMAGRVPTFLINVDGVEAADVATTMASHGYGVWAHDNWYSLGLREKLPYPQDAVRIGFIHYNTMDEVDGFLSELALLRAA
jgi:cysteine desulfurase family protein (TIGR01976 family)